MAAIAIRRVAIFCNRHQQAWISADARWDYYGVTCSVSLATMLVGFQYVWRKSRHELKKDSMGWEWHPKY